LPSESRAVLGQLLPAVPEALASRADAWRAGTVPAVAAPSASVVLIRDGAASLETYLLHRHSRMAFAASMVVFPGGRQDVGDEDADVDPIRACALRETEEETGVRLVAADLLDWAHWTTPELEPRRYATRFFVAVLPAGQVARDISGETDRAEWRAPADALRAAERGEIALMPPTRSILMELAEVTWVAEVLELARDRVITPVLPQLVRSGDGWAFDYSDR
jgi:8-oxo-dGTP pyrophosphatase MutT (NUDIX family)